MSIALTKAPQVINPEQVVRGLHPLMQRSGMVLSAAVTLQYLGQWRLFSCVLALSLVRTSVNVLFSRVLRRWLQANTVEWARLGLNLGTQVGIGLVGGWSLLLWTYVPFSMLWFHGMAGSPRLRALVYLAVMDATALWSGADPFQPLAFSLIGAMGYLLTERRADLLQHSLEQIIAQREQLAQTQGRLRLLHERALEQEKLSSLGMMAAGVAHEINNPMAFVTSNVNSLLKELKQQPELPEPLKEYVDEVLPETLEGIRRVNAIVGDLRRFSRGDPEAHAEYDLNAETETALRIAQGQLGHVQVEVDLGDVGKVVGLSRQIAQVLVNLLANAGQATQPGGMVRLTTRPADDGVRVEVRDTGTGMTPETLRNLFQPFFTTKPPGMGTGLGLAVAHGIVTAQGGRIGVETEPGKGSCFTVHLPRMARRSPSGPSQGDGPRMDA